MQQTKQWPTISRLGVVKRGVRACGRVGSSGWATLWASTPGGVLTWKSEGECGRERLLGQRADTMDSLELLHVDGPQVGASEHISRGPERTSCRSTQQWSDALGGFGWRQLKLQRSQGHSSTRWTQQRRLNSSSVLTRPLPTDRSGSVCLSTNTR